MLSLLIISITMNNEPQLDWSIRDYETFRQNPFKPQGITLVDYTPKEEEQIVTNTETGEYGIYRKLGRTIRKKKDTQPYKKLFDEALEPLSELTTPGLKVFAFITKNLVRNSDEVLIEPKEIMRFSKYKSMFPIYKGIAQLLFYRFITRKAGSDACYFVNPNMFFNGDRKSL